MVIRNVICVNRWNFKFYPVKSAIFYKFVKFTLKLSQRKTSSDLLCVLKWKLFNLHHIHPKYYWISHSCCKFILNLNCLQLRKLFLCGKLLVGVYSLGLTFGHFHLRPSHCMGICKNLAAVYIWFWITYSRKIFLRNLGWLPVLPYTCLCIYKVSYIVDMEMNPEYAQFSHLTWKSQINLIEAFQYLFPTKPTFNRWHFALLNSTPKSVLLLDKFNCRDSIADFMVSHIILLWNVVHQRNEMKSRWNEQMNVRQR